MDVETGNRESSAPVQTAPPNVLEQARLGNLDLFRTELESGNHPLDFKAGRAVYFNRTPLHLAAMEGHEEIVEFILSHPAISREVVNAKDAFGYTPLHLAVRHLRESIVQLLTTSSLVLPDRFLAVTSEPDDLGLNQGGFTPLHLAAVSGHVDIARLLVRQPCQVEFAYDPVNFYAVTWDGKTPLDIAQEQLNASHSRQNSFRDLWSRLDGTQRKAQRKAQHRAQLQMLTLIALLALSDSKWLQQYRERTAMSANAILVGSALVVAMSFGSLLQPPGGIPIQHFGASSSSPSTFGSVDRYWNSVFYICLAFSFVFSVVALMIGTIATLPSIELSSQFNVMQLRKTVGIAQLCLFVAVLFLLFCFSFACSIVLSNFATIYKTRTYYVVTWVPIVAFVYVVYFFGSWGWKMQGRNTMQIRVVTACSALLFGLCFIVARSVKE